MINFTSAINNIPKLDKRYTSLSSREKTIAILGSSSSSEELEQYLKASAEITRHFVKNGYNIVSGCGSAGIMGEVYNAAKESSVKDMLNKPIQNLAILAEPLWGDENLKDCIAIGKASSEAERIMQFSKVADNFVIFPGSAATIQETATLIQNNRYQKNGGFKQVILFGQEFWQGLVAQYKSIFNLGLLKEDPLGKLFHVVNSKEGVYRLISKK